METMNKRYIEIDSCLKCGHSGHIGTDNEMVIFICGNPVHMDFDVPRKFVGKAAYPIIVKEQKNTVHMCKIPSWCTLPKEVCSI